MIAAGLSALFLRLMAPTGAGLLMINHSARSHLSHWRMAV